MRRFLIVIGLLFWGAVLAVCGPAVDEPAVTVPAGDLNDLPGQINPPRRPISGVGVA